MAEQGSAEWKAERAGKVTASKMADVMAKTAKGAWGAGRANYMAQLVCERLTGAPADSFTNAAMQHGTETEPLARLEYEAVTGELVREVGFVPHPTIAMSGASPDGLIGADGLIEIKCPNTATHLDTLLGGGIDQKYIYQMQWQMACTGRKWCDFASFDNRLPDAMRLHVERVPRDDALISTLEAEVVKFIAELEQKLAALRAKYAPVREAA